MNFYKKMISRYGIFANSDAKLSFSQCGEDMIVNFVLNALNISNIRYLDIGAYHPTILSNTYHFYLKGHKGVCIEPNIELCALFKKFRPEDTLLNIGVGIENSAEADYYVMSSPTLNTFSWEDAKHYQEYESTKIEKILKIALVPINDLIEKYFQSSPNFISIDVEGIDLKILQSFNFSKYRPEVFCVETLTFSVNNTEEKIKNIIDFMLEQDYILYSDTYINSIFVDKYAWRNRGQISLAKGSV